MTAPDIAPLPENEIERLRALYRLQLLDTPAEECFDRLTRLTAAITRAPLVQLNLIDAERQWAKSIFGDGWPDAPRSLAFCAHTILQNDVLIVPDTRLDLRFRNHPAVIEDNSTIRFYAGTPLRTTDGYNIGTLCIVDAEPRQALTGEQKTMLQDLAALAVNLIENRLEAQRRTEAERRKDDFIATVTHEIRTPLTALHGALKLIENSVSGTLPDQTARLFTIASANAQRLTLIVNDVLDLERGAAGCLQIQPQQIDLRQSIDEAVLALEPYARSYQVELAVSDSGCPPVPADAHRLQQVLANLISNAIKYSPAGGQVTIGLAALPEKARIQVSDTGPGIPEAFQPHVFRKFAQADTADNRQPGSGLGLSIARVIVEAHGGEIGFDTKPGEGTTFWFTLPLQRADDSEQGTE
jgi:signal transduction histidine kinase